MRQNLILLDLRRLGIVYAVDMPWTGQKAADTTKQTHRRQPLDIPGKIPRILLRLFCLYSNYKRALIYGIGFRSRVIDSISSFAENEARQKSELLNNIFIFNQFFPARKIVHLLASIAYSSAAYLISFLHSQ